MQPTSQQRVCIQDSFGMPSAIVAGAGSGKTATLTNRIVYALQHPDLSQAPDIQNIMAITYTTKAAGELKSRIKAALHEAGMSEQALKVDGAWIGTIHGTCARILRENAFLAGVDPAFDVLGEDVASQLLDAAIEHALVGAGCEDDGPLGEAGAPLPAGACGPDRQAVDALFGEYARAEVKETLAALVRMANASPLPLSQALQLPPQANAAQCLCNIAHAQLHLYAASQGASGKTIDAWKPKAEHAFEQVLGPDYASCILPDGVDDAAFDAQYRQALLSVPLSQVASLVAAFPKPVNVAAHNKAQLPGQPYGVAIMLRLWALAASQAAAARHLGTLLQLVEGVQHRFAALKNARAALDNDDLIVRASQLLRSSAGAGVKQRYNQQFSLIMVDEFQDTNQMQVDMINLIAGGSSDALSSKLCVVGDAQQSIYRFRDADLAVFESHVARVRQAQQQGKGLVVNLGHNFRSHSQVLALAKGAFEPEFGANYLELVHGRSEQRIDADESRCFKGLRDGSQAADGTEVPGRVNIELVAGGTPRQKSRMAAQRIATRFKALIDCGHEPGQMAILLGSMGRAGMYAQALRDQGIACAITGGTVFRSSVEAQLIMALCDVLVNMHDTQALLAVLASPLFCLSADDLVFLLPHLGEGPSGSPARLSDEFVECVANQVPAGAFAALDYPPRVACAVRVLADAASQVGQQPLSAIVKHVLLDSGWLSRLGDNAGEQAGNAFKAIRMLEAVELETGSVARTAARALRQRIEVLKEPPGVLSAQGANFVRIMTIHASKGLQFPIVAAAEADGGGGRSARLQSASVRGVQHVALAGGAQSSGELLDGCVPWLADRLFAAADDDEALLRRVHEAICGPDAALRAAAIKAYNNLMDAAEHQRKLYVAYTRAEDCLIIALAQNSKGQLPAGAPRNIARMLCGSETFSFEESAAQVASSFAVHTTYEGHPDKTIDWQAHVHLATCDDANAWGSSSAGQAAGPVQAAAELVQGEQAAAEGAQVPLLVPTASIQPYRGSMPYRQQWASGMLSASSIKAAGAHAAYAAEPEGVFYAEDDELGASATERGTAFHALAEWSVNARQAAGVLPAPPDSRVAAIARLHGLNGAQKDRLAQQMQRWLACDVAKRLAGYSHVVAEQPFCVALDNAASQAACPPGLQVPLLLQGFIDVLAYNAKGSGSALVVDYKTGTALATDQSRRDAYGLQAQCYAYALMLQGFESVQLDFVFVDQCDDDGNLVVVSFPDAASGAYTVEGLRCSLLHAARALAVTDEKGMFS